MANATSDLVLPGRPQMLPLFTSQEVGHWSQTIYQSLSLLSPISKVLEP